MVRVSITPRVIVMVTGCAGAIPVVPNPGVAATAATGAVVRGVLVAAGLLAVPTEPAVPGRSALWPGAVTVADVAVGGVEVDDNGWFPQPATAARIPSAITRAGARHPTRRLPLLKVVPS
jgi:hypothetical protein